MTAPQLKSVAEAVQETADEMRLRSVSVADLISMELPERTMLLSPWLPSSGLAMVYAPRGIGKTWFAMCTAYAVAAGGEFLGWEASEAHPVLYIDGEMPAIALQERFVSVIQSSPYQASPDALQILTPDLQKRGMPDLSTLEGQVAIEPFTDPAKLIVVDNIATLCRSGKENEGESWLMVQEWALRMRSQGKTVLFVHHSGKGGQQRGTSRREDVLDTVIGLKAPRGDEDAQGAKFELHFEKNRGFYGDDARSREIELTNSPDGRISWAYQSLQDSTYQRVVTLLNEGLLAAEIARELEINKSTAHRHQKRAEREGLYSKPKSKKKEGGQAA
ncbi:MAG: Sigma-70 region 4 type 2 [Halomonadaceae bacterium T82-2]|nr:MAG: Sigma-70 region 4 type 2 [Halomonadaceae bacterium T82-2]